MNKTIKSLIKEIVKIEVSGKKWISGTVIDLGSDIIVLFNGVDFMYIPLEHIQKLEIDRHNEEDIQGPLEDPTIHAEGKNDELSIKETLTQAKGRNVEVYVTDNQSLYGQITEIKDDYFVFYSPIYKTMYIPIKHLKWLIPYAQNESLYGAESVTNTSSEVFESTFKNQIAKFTNKIVVLNIGGIKSHIGKINNIDEQIMEIQKARTGTILLNIEHLKTLHLA